MKAAAALTCLLALAAAPSALAGRGLRQTGAQLQEDLQAQQQQLQQLQQQVNQVSESTIITPSCQNQVQNVRAHICRATLLAVFLRLADPFRPVRSQGENAVEQANNNAAQTGQAVSGSQAMMAAWNPADGGAKPAPWPVHAWPASQTSAGTQSQISAVQAQVQANQALLQAYAMC